MNVGCVPKKLMHYAGLLGASFHDAKAYGWKLQGRPEVRRTEAVLTGDKQCDRFCFLQRVQHDWEELVSNVQNHVHMLNFRYRVGLKSAEVTYFNALATFVDPHTVVYQQSESKFASMLSARPGSYPVVVLL